MTKPENRGADPLTSSRSRRAFCGLLLLLFVVVSWTKEARAASPLTPEEQLVTAQLAYQKASGLSAYVALREIWKLWESADPAQVEAALTLAAQDSTKTAPVRAYARTLGAYARIRRGDGATAKRIFRELGFVSEWLVVGPFDNEGKAGFQSDFEPDINPSDPIIPGQAFSGKERPVRYRELPEVFPYGYVDWGSLVRPAINVCGFARTFLEGGSRPRLITLWVGARGAVRARVNGQTVLEDDAYRDFDTDRLSTTVVLEPGINQLTVKVCGDEAPPLFSVRLADASGAPDDKLLARATVELSREAGPTVTRVLEKGAPLPRHPALLAGPLDQVLAIAGSARAGAEDLELAATYLRHTRGDDRVRHQARDLVTRALEKQASVELHLLAAELAEDRNAARGSIDAAEALAHPGDVEVLLARARHLRAGPNPREAFEYYDRVLGLDPDNLTALEGEVDLQNAAGLRRSALASLQAAYERRPHSVLLANMVASQLSALGYSTHAQEAEDRYAALRADDASYLSSRLELALSRRNFADAEHFLTRITGADPDSAYSYRLAARVHRAMGEQERALSDLERAREIVPEDIGVLQHLADLKGRAGKTREQLALLREVLRLRPQEADVRKYVEHIEPPAESADEKYAMPARDFLALRHAPAAGHPRRTLRDLTVSRVFDNGLGTQFRQVVFQPLTDAAAALSRQYAFQYQADTQRVELRGAKVYRADGSIDEAIESGEGAADDPSISMYTSARTFYVQFPRLEPGDVVELRYRIEDITHRNEFDDYYGDVVFLQSDEPIFSAEYVLITPKSRKLVVDAKVPGVEQTVQVKGSERTYRFVAKDVPAIAPEPEMPPWPEVLGFVHVSTYQSWDALGKWYWGLVREQLDLDAETRALARKITAGATTDREKVQAIYGWVIKNTRYVALEFGIYGFKPRRCVQTINRGWGDCKDKATVIVTLLRELGIQAHLVILRTQMRGDFRSNIASLAPFDHAIAYVPSLDLYLDGTAEYTGTFELPAMDQEALGFLVLDGQAKLVRLPAADPKKNVVARHTLVQLSRDGSANLSLTYDVTGTSAASYRARYEAAATRKDRLARDLGGEFPGFQIAPGGIETGDLLDVEAPVHLRVSGKMAQFARPEGTQLSIPVTLGVQLTPEYAALSQRTQDVVIRGFSTREETVVVTLPAGVHVQSGPPDQSGSTPFGSFSVTTEITGQKVTVKSRLELSATRITPKEYPAFRKFCQTVDEAMSHRLLAQP